MRDSARLLVIGGGPAGATASGLLAREGFDVTLVEREHFPRYHIGESILPSVKPILSLLGAYETIASHGFQPKGGTFFAWGPEEWDVRFADLGEGTTSAWQVVRSEFDKILLDQARANGVEVHEGVTIRDVRFDGDRPVAATWVPAQGDGPGGDISFDYLIDASGRGGVLANRYLKNRRFHDVFKNVAAWCYWEGAKKLDRGPEGAIAVCSVPNGWFWAIPLHNGTLSVGLVTSKDLFNSGRTRLGSIEKLYFEAMKDCPIITELLEGATKVSDMRTEQDYSYVAERFAGPGYFISGDAACFLDPLLSTGVHLATYAGLLAAASLTSVLRGEVSEEEATDFYHTWYRHAYERMLVLVSVFYESYRGKDYHFYNAQKLTHGERERLHLHEAFLHIITGVEDLADAKDKAFAVTAAQLAGTAEMSPTDRYNVMKRDITTAPVHEHNAVNGLYLRTEPGLGLSRAASAP